MSAYELVGFLALAMALLGLFIFLLASNDRLKRERDAARQIQAAEKKILLAEVAKAVKLREALTSTLPIIICGTSFTHEHCFNVWTRARDVLEETKGEGDA